MTELCHKKFTSFNYFLSGSHRRKRTDGLFRRPLGRSSDTHCHGNGSGGVLERSSPPVTGHFSPRELLLGRSQVLTPPLDSPERRRRSAAAGTITMTVSRHESLRRPEDTPPIRRSSSGLARGRDHDTLPQVMAHLHLHVTMAVMVI